MPFKYLGNGLSALRMSLGCHQMRCHLLFKFFPTSEFSSLHIWVCLLLHKLWHTKSIWLSKCFVVVTLVFAKYLSGFIYWKAKQMFIGLEPTFCWQKQTHFFVIHYRYTCTANLDQSVSLLFIHFLQFLKATSAFSFRYMGMKFARTRKIVKPVSAKLGFPNTCLIYIA